MPRRRVHGDPASNGCREVPCARDASADDSHEQSSKRDFASADHADDSLDQPYKRSFFAHGALRQREECQGAARHGSGAAGEEEEVALEEYAATISGYGFFRLSFGAASGSLVARKRQCRRHEFVYV